MNANKNYKNRLEQFLQTERGKRFINFTYSIGAAIVILGAMFKLLHFPFGNEMLFIGMVTEVIIFIISAFDTPIRDYHWDQVFPALSADNPESQVGSNSGIAQQTTPILQQTAEIYHNEPSPSVTSGTAPSVLPDNLSPHTEEYAKQMESINRTLSGLNNLYEIQLKSVGSQIDSIEQINKGLSRLRSLYDDTLPESDVIKSETEKMAAQLKELNEVYSRMLQAMTTNKS